MSGGHERGNTYTRLEILTINQKTNTAVRSVPMADDGVLT